MLPNGSRHGFRRSVCRLIRAVTDIHDKGDVSGGFESNVVGGPVAGGFGGAPTTADLSGWSPGSTIPWSVIEPWLRTNNISFLANTTGYSPSSVYAEVVMKSASGDPIAMPIPEPNALALAASMILGAFGLRRKLIRR